MIFVGIDWSEAHHDVCVMNTEGRVLAKGRVPEGVEGLARLHEMVAANAEGPLRWPSVSSSIEACWWAPSWPRATPCTP